MTDLIFIYLWIGFQKLFELHDKYMWSLTVNVCELLY
jgi:hypothetical protein